MKIVLPIYTPHLLAEWHEENEKIPHRLSTRSDYKAKWRCRDCHYVWNTRIFNRTLLNTGCPECVKRRIAESKIGKSFKRNLLHTEHPNLVKEWHPNNERDIMTITSGSGFKAKWICSTCDWVWLTDVKTRATKDSGCPKCKAGITPTHNIAVLHPHLLNDWDPNNDISPRYVAPASNKKYKWVCSTCQHMWNATARSRTEQKRGCPLCARGLSATYNLATLYPQLLAEWHTDNTEDPYKLLPHSKTKAKWKCKDCSHVWNTSLSTRTSGSGCPECAENRRILALKNKVPTH